MIYRLFISIGLITLLFGCKSENARVDLGYEYYPAEPGMWVSYTVDSIWHHVDETSDTAFYQIKERIDSIFTDDEGRSARRIERFYRTSSSDPWLIKDIWMAAITPRMVEKVEENIRFVRLTFPVKNDAVWNGNSVNEMGTWNYSYRNVGEAYSTGNTVFAESAVVEQEGPINLIEQQKGTEVYARNVGLISKTLIYLETDINYTSNPVPANIYDGYELYYRYTAHGQD